MSIAGSQRTTRIVTTVAIVLLGAVMVFLLYKNQQMRNRIESQIDELQPRIEALQRRIEDQQRNMDALQSQAKDVRRSLEQKK
jgi:septal ring factor EnvC (AmiA/AmiB activator)